MWGGKNLIFKVQVMPSETQFRQNGHIYRLHGKNWTDVPKPPKSNWTSLNLGHLGRHEWKKRKICNVWKWLLLSLYVGKSRKWTAETTYTQVPLIPLEGEGNRKWMRRKLSLWLRLTEAIRIWDKVPRRKEENKNSEDGGGGKLV